MLPECLQSLPRRIAPDLIGALGPTVQHQPDLIYQIFNIQNSAHSTVALALPLTNNFLKWNSRYTILFRRFTITVYILKIKTFCSVGDLARVANQ